MDVIPHDKLCSIFEYDPITGCLINKQSRRRARAGSQCGNTYISDKGYLKVKVDGKIYKTHRIIFYLITGRWTENVIHHIDGNKLNNRMENLKEITEEEHNSIHSKTRTFKLSTIFGQPVGVTWNKNKNKWEARIGINKTKIHLGSFSDINDAIKKRKEKEAELIQKINPTGAIVVESSNSRSQ